MAKRTGEFEMIVLICLITFGVAYTLGWYLSRFYYKRFEENLKWL